VDRLAGKMPKAALLSRAPQPLIAASDLEANSAGTSGFSTAEVNNVETSTSG